MPAKIAETIPGWANSAATARKIPKIAYAIDERRDERRERLADEELLAADRGDQDRLERALLALADHRVGATAWTGTNAGITSM